MKSHDLTKTLPVSFLYLFTVLSTSSIAATPDREDRASEQPYVTENPTREAHPSVTNGECSNTPNNVGHGGVENAAPTNPNAPPQLQGAQNERNPASQRNENPQVAQSEANCVDVHEDPNPSEMATQ